MRILLMVMLVLGNCNLWANTKFKDLTGQKYKGAESNLRGLNLESFGFDCSGSGSSDSGENTIISWKGSSAIRETFKKNYLGSVKDEVLKSYTISFQLYNRRGEKVSLETFKYDGREHKDNAFVLPGLGGDSDRCSRDLVELKKKYRLSYGKVEYWVSKIEWEKKKYVQADVNYNRAFTIKDQLASLKKNKKKRKRAAKKFKVLKRSVKAEFSLIKPKIRGADRSFHGFDIEGERYFFSLGKAPIDIGLVKRVSKWSKFHEGFSAKYCGSHSCGIDDNRNFYNQRSIDNMCRQETCLVIDTRKLSYLKPYGRMNSKLYKTQKRICKDFIKDLTFSKCKNGGLFGKDECKKVTVGECHRLVSSIRNYSIDKGSSSLLIIHLKRLRNLGWGKLKDSYIKMDGRKRVLKVDI